MTSYTPSPSGESTHAAADCTQKGASSERRLLSRLAGAALYRWTPSTTHYFRSRKEARVFIEQSEVARHKLGDEFFIRNRPRPEAAKPLKKLQDEFLKSRKAMNCRERTLVQYESYLRVICTEFGETDVTRIIRQDIEDWIEESDWSPRTRKNYLVTLTTLLNHAMGRGYRADNPAAGIARPILGMIGLWAF